MSFGSAPIKTSLQAAAEVLLSELYFDQNRHVAVDYGRRLNRRGVLQIVPEVLKESLHPVLISVFKLDINLMLLLCGGLIFPTALQPFAVGTKGGQR